MSSTSGMFARTAAKRSRSDEMRCHVASGSRAASRLEVAARSFTSLSSRASSGSGGSIFTRNCSPVDAEAHAGGARRVVEAQVQARVRNDAGRVGDVGQVVDVAVDREATVWMLPAGTEVEARVDVHDVGEARRAVRPRQI